MAYTFPDHMCTSIQTQNPYPKMSWGLFPVGMREQCCDTLVQCQHSLPSPRLSSPLIPLHFLTFAPKLLPLSLYFPHFHPPLSFSIFVSFFLPKSRTNSNDMLLHDINTARVIKHFLLQPDHCTDTESAVEIITGHWRKVRNNGPHKNGSER